MTSILKQEDRLFLYRSEKPFPKKDTYKFGIDGFQTKDYCDAVSSWFSSARRYECKDPARFLAVFASRHGFLDWPEHLKTGIDVSWLKVEIKTIRSGKFPDFHIKEYAYLHGDDKETDQDVRAIAAATFAQYMSAYKGNAFAWHIYKQAFDIAAANLKR